MKKYPDNLWLLDRMNLWLDLKYKYITFWLPFGLYAIHHTFTWYKSGHAPTGPSRRTALHEDDHGRNTAYVAETDRSVLPKFFIINILL